MSRQPSIPSPPQVTPDLLSLVMWVSDALRQLEAAGFSSQDLDVVYEEPAHPQEGMVRYFGTGGFDPGNGPGPYCYVNWYGTPQWRPMFPV